MRQDVERTVVSEGVETLDQYEALTRLGTDACQGFYFARPMRADGINILLEGGAGGQGIRLPVAA